MSKYQCLNCTHLGHCPDTDADKVMSGYYCSRWQEAPSGLVDARARIIHLFGVSGLKAVISKDLKEEED